jgi:hypothetical protein
MTEAQHSLGWAQNGPGVATERRQGLGALGCYRPLGLPGSAARVESRQTLVEAR